MDRSGIQAAVSGLDAEGLCRRRPVGEGGGQRAASELVVIHNLGTGGEAESSASAGRGSAAVGCICE